MACKRSAVRSRLSPPPYPGRKASGLSLSSRGLGHRPFTAVTGVRIPVGTPDTRPCHPAGFSALGRALPPFPHCSLSARQWVGRTLQAAMRRQASAQTRQARAQAWQWSCWWRPHSSAQASQIWAHTRQRSVAKRLPEAMKALARRQMRAQSRSSRMHSAMAATCSSPRQASAQWSQASAQALQASIQSACSVWDIGFLLAYQ